MRTRLWLLLVSVAMGLACAGEKSPPLDPYQRLAIDYLMAGRSRDTVRLREIAADSLSLKAATRIADRYPTLATEIGRRSLRTRDSVRSGDTLYVFYKVGPALSRATLQIGVLRTGTQPKILYIGLPDDM